MIIPPKLNGPNVASRIEVKPNRFLWWPYLPEGEQCVAAGAGGDGKGLLGCDIAARLTTGREWPLSDEYAPVRNVYWFEAEDSINKTVTPRLIAAGADLDRIGLYEKEKARKKFNEITRGDLEGNKIGLIVLSPFLSFLQVENFNSETHVRDALERLASKIADLPCSTFSIMHPNKKIDLAAIERIIGSVAFRNFIRSIMLTKAESDTTTRIVHAKYNLSIKGNDLLFTKINTRKVSAPRGQYLRLEWENTDENIDPATAFDRRKLTDDDKNATRWLHEYLADHKWHDYDDIIREAAIHSYSPAAIKQAKYRSDGAIVHDQTGGFGSHRPTKWKLKRAP